MDKKRTVTAKKNPVFQGKGLCDPHGLVVGNTLYLFMGRDADPKGGGFAMDDWQVWKTTDGVNFTHCTTILPEETFAGKTHDCWATHAVEKNGFYYFYFSDANHSIGVMKSDRPNGGYKDVLHRPLVAENSTPTMSYDPHVFIDDDGTPYLLFGAPKWAYGDNADGYYIARLKETMIELDETPRKVCVNHPGDDKPALHKFRGVYYLSWASFYATSETVYGPYTFRGNIGVSRDHGSFFEWNHQWFFSFGTYDPYPMFRNSALTYIHYRENGEMAADSLINEYGVGKYSADWNRIFAAWYMKASRYMKRESKNGGFEVADMQDGDYLVFPKVIGIPKRAEIHFLISADKTAAPGRLEVRRETPHGALLAAMEINKTQGYDYGCYTMLTATLAPHKKTEDLCFIVRGNPGCCLTLSSFSFSEI